MPKGSFGTSYVVMDPTKLAEVLRGPNGPVVRRLIEDGELVKAEAKRLVGVSQPDPVPRRKPGRKPGTLRDSIVKRVVDMGGDPAVLVGSDDPVALLHHEGTVPHPISPRDPVRTPRLVFFWQRVGRIVAFPRVSHPGTRPNRFLTNALDVLRGRY